MSSQLLLTCRYEFNEFLCVSEIVLKCPSEVVRILSLNQYNDIGFTFHL